MEHLEVKPSRIQIDFETESEITSNFAQCQNQCEKCFFEINDMFDVQGPEAAILYFCSLPFHP